MTRRVRPAGSLAALIALLVIGASPLMGQGWVAEAAAGSTTHEAVPGAPESLSVALGLRREGARWLYLSAGFPLDGAGIPWGAGGWGGRWVRPLSGGTSLGMDGAAHLFAFRDAAAEVAGGGGTVEVLPVLSRALGATRVELRSGVMTHLAGAGDSLDSRTVSHTDLRVARALGPLRLIGDGRLVIAGDGSFPFAGAAVELPAGTHGLLWGSVGRWMGGGLDEAVWGLGGRVTVAGGELYASYRRDADDPLLRAGPRTVWSIGISRSIGRVRPAAGALPAPTVAGATVTFRLPVADFPDAPAVGGDFNGWHPVPMRLRGAAWELSLTIPPGLHRFAFRSAGGEWFVPEGMPGRVDDGFGGHAATVLVP